MDGDEVWVREGGRIQIGQEYFRSIINGANYDVTKFSFGKICKLEPGHE